MDPMDAPQRRPRSSGGAGNVISVTSDGPPDSPYEEFSLDEPPPKPDDTPPPPPKGAPRRNGNGNGAPIACPSCGAVNPANNRHCQECGARLRQGPLPTAPRPAVQATAGVRAALAISGLLLGVILIALFFNIFSGDDPGAVASTSSTSTTVAQAVETGPIEVLDQTCTPQGISNLICANLTSGNADEYQVSWEETADQGVTIELTFREQMAITQILWTNIEDETRFRQNYRAQGLTILADDAVAGAHPVRLQDQRGTQQVPFSSLNTIKLTIHIETTYQAEEVEQDIFDELAIVEIEVIGRPVVSRTDTTNPTGTTVPGDGSTSTTQNDG